MEPPGVVHRSDLVTSAGSGSGKSVHCDEGDEYDMQLRRFWPISGIGGHGEVLDIKIEEEYDDLQPVDENSQKTSGIVGDDDALIYSHDRLFPTKSELEDTLDYPFQNAIVVYENTSCTETEHHDFCIGDTVWVESEINSWWPGRICDPVRDTFPTPQNPGMDLFLVRYINEWSFSWRAPSQIMHFSDGYNQFSRKNQSRKFNFAVKKAMEEINKGAIQSVSCPCLWRESSNENNGVIFERIESSVIPFEPKDFLTRLKLASSSSVVPNELEIMVIRSYLLVFYTFLGHCHLPLLGLVDSVVTEEEETSFHGSTMADGSVLRRNMCYSSSPKKLHCRNRITEERSVSVLNLPARTDFGIGGDDIRSTMKAKRGYESRERRRSKYLSPPYVDVSFRRKCAASEGCIPTVIRADCFSPDREDDSLSVVIGLAARPCPTVGGGRVRKRKLDKLCVSSPLEMMDVLHLMATGCCFTPGNGFLSSTCSELFFRFRNSVFRGGSDYGFQGERELGMVEVSATDTSDSLGPSSVSRGQQIRPENARKRMKKKMTWKTEEDSVFCWQREGMADPRLVKPGEGNQENCGLEWKPPLDENLPDLAGKWSPNSTALVVREVESDTKSENQRHASPGSTPDSSDDKGSWLFDPYSSEGGPVSFPHLKKGTCANLGPSPLQQNRGRSKPKNQISSSTTIVPDLNRNTDDLLPLSVPETGVVFSPKKKKPRTEKDRPTGTGNTLLLTFDEGYPPPSKDSLIQAFYSFGELVESETEQAGGSAETGVVFVRSCDAGEAFRSLERVNPFGPSLVKYRLLHQSGATRPAMDADGITSAIPLLVRPAAASPVKTVCAEAPVITEAPSLPLIRRNLEVMTEVLERSGDNLSPETKAKLQEEIKGLLRKVSTMAASPLY